MRLRIGWVLKSCSVGPVGRSAGGISFFKNRSFDTDFNVVDDGDDDDGDDDDGDADGDAYDTGSGLDSKSFVSETCSMGFVVGFFDLPKSL